MLMIEPLLEKNSTKSEHVKCPICTNGRLCDKNVGEKVRVVSTNLAHLKRTSCGIIVKCPKCSNKFKVYMFNE